ncbi:flagellar biosynthetic protein FlhB [Aequitasia blattaphilus]|uniref:Flagellar biosynthetic protein FlhB n=1 Tax=Aequitasia blattaphilus TaxID=2949332 RepID=A0ABT1E9M3_9FIRM|nr:flagellar biosynthesis protein FlhB [Aequitasia blattaphilus]MCP1102522.1 flagellar biosynthesis protein FlhB [Aequitasia blattaphilus]MCR8615162.1 flagellar biosynthesis protein FlhB [Aequitasia blattaphilus]
MAAENKTEKATPKKRKDERKEGNIFMSKDVVSVVFIFGSFYALRILFPYTYENLSHITKRFIYLSGTMTDLNQDNIGSLGQEFLTAAAQGILPISFVCLAIGVLAYGVQTRFIFVGKSLKPKFSKLNPVEGIKKMFALKNAVELLKSLIKTVILVAILYSILKDSAINVVRTMDMSIQDGVKYMFSIMMSMIFRVCIFFAAVAFLDYLFQRWDYERKIMMTKQEIKEEHKQAEGNPEVKGKIKETQRQRARMRMMQAVPDADVIIRNPTHFAVALKYDQDKNRAPIVLAKGKNELAFRIIEVAQENGVTCVENKPLARGLYAEAELNQEIPMAYYGAVAEVLVYVLKLNKKLR